MQENKNDGKTGKKRSWNLTIKKWKNKLVIQRKNYIPQKRKKTSTIETKFDKFGNKVSMLETLNEVDEEIITKENDIPLSRDPTSSFQSGIVYDFDKHGISLIIDAE